MSLKDLAQRLRPVFLESFSGRTFRPCRVFLTASDMKSRTVVRHASDIEPNVAFNKALDQLSVTIAANEPNVLRAAWVVDAESMTWADFNTLISSTKRNEFNRGVALSPDFSIAFTALELKSNLILYSADNPNGVFNVEAASSLVRERFNRDLPILKSSSPIIIFDTAGVSVLDPKYLSVETALDGFMRDRTVPTVEQVKQNIEELSVRDINTSSLNEAKIFFGGNVNIGRHIHLLPSDMKYLGDIPSMNAADIRIVNLLGAASALGNPVNKNYMHYVHARPEQINILTDCGIDVVLTANHHGYDYGADALSDQNKLLGAAGIAHVGSGANLDEVSKPLYVKASDLIVAIYSIDATTEQVGAMIDRGGVWHLPSDNLEQWHATFDKKISEARRHADAVFVAVNFEPIGLGALGREQSFYRMREIGRALIDSGADGVLGCNSYWFNRVEKYSERPIIYGAGSFISDGNEADAGAYLLTIDVDGVKMLTFNALHRGNGKIEPATADKDRINNAFLTQCRALGTNATVKSDGTIEVTFKPAPRKVVEHSEPPMLYDPATVEHRKIEPLMEPLPEWTVEQVPDDARIKPITFGRLKLVGYRFEKSVLTKRELLFVETYWTIDVPVKSQCLFIIEGLSRRTNDMPLFGAGMDHEFADWQFPVSRWKPGVIYRERLGLRMPALNRIANVDLRLKIRVLIDGFRIRTVFGSKSVKLRLTELPQYRLEFSDVINQSEPGHCWTAEQLATVTGGRWLVEPPKGWYVQSVLRDMRFYNQAETPVMFVASRRSRYLFHTGGDPNSSTYDNHFMIAKYADKIAGAMIDHEVEGLPKDLPLLLVEDSVKASIELGFAARRRFKGKTIAVSGDAGKTTTVKMLEHVLKDAGETVVPFGLEEANISAATTFANVKADAAYAIVELSKAAISNRRGSITYDLMPDIVIVTSNLGLEKDTETAAKVKRRVFCGAVEGGYAILNRDMKHFEIFEAAAKSHKLNVLTFGSHEESTVRMPEIKRGGSVLIDGTEYKLDVALSNEQLYDALAVLAVTSALSHGGGGVERN